MSDLRRDLVFLAPALLTALLLRLWDLGGTSLWLDELFTVRVAAVADDLATALGADVHPPLYYAAMRLWAPVAGGSELLWRLPSALAGVGTVAATALLGRRLAGRAAGGLAAWLVALSPLAVDLDREVRGNAWMLLFATVAAVLAAGPADRAPRWWVPAFGAACALAGWTHFYGAFAVIGLLLWLLLRPARLPGLLPAGALGLASLAPWLPVLAGQAGRFAADPWYPPAPADSLAWLWPALWGGHLGPAVLCLLAALLGLLRAPRAVLPLLTGLLSLVLLPQLVELLLAPSLRPRNVLPLVPLIAVAAGAGLASLRPPAVAAAAAGLLLGAHALITLPTQVLAPATEDWRGAAEAFTEQAGPDAVLVAHHPMLWRFYLPDDVLPAALDEAPAAAPELWILLAHDLEPDGLAALIHRAEGVEVQDFAGARLLRLAPLDRVLSRTDFTTADGAAPPAEGEDDPALHFYTAGAVRSPPLALSGRCRVGITGRSEDAAGEPARVALRVEVAGATVVDHHVVPGPTLQWTPPVPLTPATPATVEVAFVNDTVVPGEDGAGAGSEDRNAHVETVRVRCGEGDG